MSLGILVAVVSSDVEQAIALFPSRDEAEEMLALVLEDEPWRDVGRSTLDPLNSWPRAPALW